MVQLGFCLWFRGVFLFPRPPDSHASPPRTPPCSGLCSRLPGTSSRVCWGPWLGVSGGITAGEPLQVPIPPPGLPGARTCLTCANPHIHSLCPQLLTPSRPLLQPTAPAPVSESLQAPPCHSHHTLRPPFLQAVLSGQGGLHPGSPTPPELSSPRASANSSPTPALGEEPPEPTCGPVWPRPGLRSNGGPAPLPGPPLTSS